MPTVYLPLGSASAHGDMGKMVIYQGTMVRQYVVPRDPRTAAQLNVRQVFHDVSKITRTAGLWVRAALKTVYGPRWFTEVYKAAQYVIRNQIAPFAMNADEIWNTFTEEQQAAWNDAAPYQATFNEPGRVWWWVIFGMQKDFVWQFDIPIFEDVAPDAPVDWWNRNLDGVQGAGMLDDIVDIGATSGTWDLVSDSNAHGGSYRKVPGSTSGAFGIYFYGRRASFIHMQGPDQGEVVLVWDMGNIVHKVLYNASVEWQQEFNTGSLPLGLHFVQVEKIGFSDVNIDAVEIT